MKDLMPKLIKPLGLLILFILICTVISRFFANSETLADYAAKNPEIAYATPAKVPTPAINSPEPSQTPAAPSPTPDAEIPDTDNPGEQLTPDPEHDNLQAEVPAERQLYQEGFYKEPLSDAMIAAITGISFPVSAEEAELMPVSAINITSDISSLAISYNELCYLSILHYDFNAQVQTGELICNRAIADDLLAIFYELYQNEYQIEKIRLIEEYLGDDTASMLDNNTSCFNYRLVDGSTSLSKHALGLAIDINPFYNPYVVFQKDGSTYISPTGSEIYTDRTRNFPYKIDEQDLCYKLFIQHGFIWGGNWNSSKDYQHFQKTLR